MTVSTTTASTTLLGNGSQTSFQFAFVWSSASTIQVLYTDPSGNQTTLSPSSYTLTLNPALPGALWGIGGSVVYPTVGSPIPNGSLITIQRVLPYQQLISIQNQGDFNAQVIEQALDLIVMEVQQGIGSLGKAFVANPADATAPAPAPPIAQRAGNFTFWDSSGNLNAGSPINNTSVSSAMIPVVTAGTLADARTALGVSIPTAPNNGIVAETRNLVIKQASNTTATATWDEMQVETVLNGTIYKAGSQSFTLNFATVGVNGLDTGAIAPSTFYSVYAICNPTTNTFGVLACTTAASSASVYGGTNAPSGYTASALIGLLLTDGSSHIRVSTQYNRDLWYQAPVNIFTGLGGPAANTLTSQSISAGVPVIAKTVSGILGQSSSASQGGFGVAGDATGYGLQGVGAASGGPLALQSFSFIALPFRNVPLITPQTIFWATGNSSVSSCRMSVTGFSF